MVRSIGADFVSPNREMRYCDKHMSTTIVFSHSDVCPACDNLSDMDVTVADLRNKNRELRKELKLAKYELRDTRDKLSVLKSETAEYLAMRKQVKDEVDGRM